MCSDFQANSFQLTLHCSKGGGDLICRGSTLPGHPAGHTVPTTHSERRLEPSFGWAHTMVAVPGPGEPSMKRHTATALPAHQCQLGTVRTLPSSCQRQPAGTRGASKAAAPPQNASKKPAASQPHDSCTSQSLDTLPAFHWLQEDTQTSTKPHQREANLFKLNK